MSTAQKTSQGSHDVKVIDAKPLKLSVPLSKFVTTIPALKVMDAKLQAKGYEPFKSKDDIKAFYVSFSGGGSEHGFVKLFLQRYSKPGALSHAYAARLQISSNKRRLLSTAAIVPQGRGLKVMYLTKDENDPSHGVDNPDTAGGCFDRGPNCPPPGDNPGELGNDSFSHCWTQSLDAIKTCWRRGIDSPFCWASVAIAVITCG